MRAREPRRQGETGGGGEEPRVSAFRLQARGLERVLGSIEAEVMEHIWAADAPLSIRDVQSLLAAHRPLSFNTVASVMGHLVDKGFLHRQAAGRGHVFTAAVGREEFRASVSRRVADGLVRDFGDLAVSQFVAALREQDPEALRRLEALVRQGRDDTVERRDDARER